jgi:hypothetical protein
MPGPSRARGSTPVLRRTYRYTCCRLEGYVCTTGVVKGEATNYIDVAQGVLFYSCNWGARVWPHEKHARPNGTWPRQDRLQHARSYLDKNWRPRSDGNFWALGATIHHHPSIRALGAEATFRPPPLILPGEAPKCLGVRKNPQKHRTPPCSILQPALARSGALRRVTARYGALRRVTELRPVKPTLLGASPRKTDAFRGFAHYTDALRKRAHSPPDLSLHL